MGVINAHSILGVGRCIFENYEYVNPCCPWYCMAGGSSGTSADQAR